MSRVVLHPDAEQDLADHAASPLPRAGLDQTPALLGEFRREFARIGGPPGIGHCRPECDDDRVGFWKVCWQLIFYRADTDPVQILGIVHGAMSLASRLLGRVSPYGVGC